MANLSNIDNILRISSSGVGLNKDNTGPSELDIESAGADMIDMTRTGLKTYRFAISGSSDFSIFDVAANADRLTIDSAGNVGIGGSPNDALEVAGNSAATHRIRINNANASGSETLAFVQGTTFKSWIEYNNSNGNFDIWQYTNNDLRFGTNNTERLVINSSGNATFAGDITLDDGTGASPSLIFTNSSDETWKIFNGSQGVLNFTEGTNDRFQLLQGGDVVISESLRVGGNVNNANTFTYTLQTRGLLVAGNSGTSQSNLYLHRDDATITNDNVIGNLHFSGQDGASNIGAQIQVKAVGSWNPTSAGSNMIFSTCNSGTNTLSERMRITSGGQVNMTKGSSGTVLYLDSVNAYDAETGIQLSAGRAKISGFLNTTGGTPGSSLRFYTMPDNGSVTERMRITSGGNVNISNNSSYTRINVDNTKGSAGGTSAIQFGLSDGAFVTADAARVESRIIANPNAAMDFKVYGSGLNTIMSLLGTGKVGIGTDNPSAQLHNYSTATTNVFITGHGTAAQNNWGAQNCMFVKGDNGLLISKANVANNTNRIFNFYNDANGYAQLYMHAGSTTAGVKIQASGTSYFNGGKVGIGITSPSTIFHVDAGQYNAGNLTNNVAVYIGGAFVNNDAYHKEGGLLVISGTNATQTSAGIAFQTRNTNNTNYWKSSILMDRGGTIRFTLGGAGTGAGSDKFTIGTTGRINMHGLDAKGTTGSDVRFLTSTQELYYLTSSRRYKTNIVNLENSLDKINALRPVRFKDIKTEEDACGLIAEETFEIIPDVVFTKEIEGFDEPQIEGLNYSDLVPFLIKSIQELKANNDSLKARIETLENN